MVSQFKHQTCLIFHRSSMTSLPDPGSAHNETVYSLSLNFLSWSLPAQVLLTYHLILKHLLARQDEDPDRPGCTMSCCGGSTDHSFSHATISPDFTPCLPNPRVAPPPSCNTCHIMYYQAGLEAKLTKWDWGINVI